MLGDYTKQTDYPPTGQVINLTFCWKKLRLFCSDKQVFFVFFSFLLFYSLRN